MFNISRFFGTKKCLVPFLLNNNKCKYSRSYVFRIQKQHFSIAKNSNNNENAKNMFPFTTLNQSEEEKKEMASTLEKAKTTADGPKSKYMKYFFIYCSVSMAGTVLLLLYANGKDIYDSDGNLIVDEYQSLPFVKKIFYRNLREVEYLRKILKEPSREKLLPDVLQYPYFQPPYTLVLEFSDFVVHPEWTYLNGWRFKKRPGIVEFLRQLHENFEIVVYTAESGMNVYPALQVLDPDNYISYKLFRDSTNFIDGHHVKDLDRLNRDLSKVIVLDHNDNNVKNHPNNLFKVGRWSGDMSDRSLMDLADFLNLIVTSEVKDVREYLKYYRNFDDPLGEFLRRKHKYLEDENSLTSTDSDVKFKKSYIFGSFFKH